MTLSELRDAIERRELADWCGVGRIDAERRRAVGVFERSGKSAPVKAIGGLESYGVHPVRIVYRGTENAAETEREAGRIWDAVCAVRKEGTILFILPDMTAPTAEADGDGVYEYRMDFNVYYTK